jgi:hypothetical protein
MIEADSVHSTPRRFTPKIVAGTDLATQVVRAPRRSKAVAAEHPKMNPAEIAELCAGIEARIQRDAPEGAPSTGPAASEPEEETPRERRRRERQEVEPASATARNHRMRLQRRDVWGAANAATRFWAAKREFDDVCVAAWRHGVEESFAYDADENRMSNVQKWREALVAQLLTPAPDVAAVAWKRRAFASRQIRYTDARPERIERAIADDVAWLAAHPVRQSKRRESFGPRPAEELEPA